MILFSKFHNQNGFAQIVIFFIVAVGVLATSASVYFYLHQNEALISYKAIQNPSSSAPAANTDFIPNKVVSTDEAVIGVSSWPEAQTYTDGDTLQLLLAPTNSRELALGQSYKIQWKQDRLLYYSNNILICLIGIKDGREIPAIKDYNKNLCTYLSGSLSGSYLIATTTLSSGTYSWVVPQDTTQRFLLPPDGFKIRLLVFDDRSPEGLSEWAGNVGFAESNILRLVTSTVNAQNLIRCSSAPQDINDLFETPKLFPGLSWYELPTSSAYAAAYTKPPDVTLYRIDLPSRSWSSSFTYDESGSRKTWNEFFDYYGEQLSKGGWQQRINVRGFEISGLAADGPGSGIQGYIKILDGKVRAVVISHSTSYKGNFPDVEGPNKTTFNVLVSDVAYLEDILPGYAPSAYLGVLHFIITPEIQQKFSLPVDYGAMVTSSSPFELAVKDGSPAEKVGILAGDIILAVDKQLVDQKNILTDLIERHCPGDQVTLRVLSGGTEKDLRVMLEEF